MGAAALIWINRPLIARMVPGVESRLRIARAGDRWRQCFGDLAALRGPGLASLERISATLPAIHAADGVRNSPETCIIRYALTRMQGGRRGRRGRARGNRSLLSGCYPRLCEHQGGLGRGCWPAMLAQPFDEPSDSGA
jgi:hypothetical protein